MNSKSRSSLKIVKLSDEDLCKIARQIDGVESAMIISPSEVVMAPWVRLKCQFGCDGYGQSLVCPPFTPSSEQMRKVLDTYSRGILIHFDSDADVKAIVAVIDRDIFLRGAWKAFGLGAGPCYFCKNCPVEQARCQHSEKARPSMEACGIDVFSTIKKTDFHIEVVRSRKQCPNYYSLVLVD